MKTFLVRSFAAITVCVAAFVVSPSAIAGATLYGVDYPASATLYGVNQSTGALSAIGPVGLDNIGDLTSDNVSTIWGVQITTNDLVTFNPSTGVGTLGPSISGTSSTGAPVPIVSLAYDPVSGVLYGNTSVPYGGVTADQLFTINTTTGAASPVGLIGSNSVFALAFDTSGVLYGVDGSGNLITISTLTGAGTTVGNTGLGAVYDIAFDPTNDVLFAADSGTSSLYTLNASTGADTLVGSYGSSTNIVGLAFLNVPEPFTLSLFGAGLFGVGVMGRRKKLIA